MNSNLIVLHNNVHSIPQLMNITYYVCQPIHSFDRRAGIHRFGVITPVGACGPPYKPACEIGGLMMQIGPKNVRGEGEVPRGEGEVPRRKRVLVL